MLVEKRNAVVIDSLSECVPMYDILRAILYSLSQGETIGMSVHALVVTLLEDDVVVRVANAKLLALFGNVRQEPSRTSKPASIGCSALRVITSDTYKTFDADNVVPRNVPPVLSESEMFESICRTLVSDSKA